LLLVEVVDVKLCYVVGDIRYNTDNLYLYVCVCIYIFILIL
jgi:hypothetical protein